MNENKEELAYLELAKEILVNGSISTNRTSNNTKKLFGAQLRFDLSDGKIPLITTKYVNYASVLKELEWFIVGSTSNRYLKDKLGCGIWDKWAACDGSFGSIYGAMWRRRPVSIGAYGQDNTVEELQQRYKRTDDIIEMEQSAIEEVASINLDWKDMRDAHPNEFKVWINMLEFCGSRYLLAMQQGGVSVTTKMEASRSQRVAWFENIMSSTVWKETNINMFGSMQPSDIYKPWLSFKKFLRDVGSIAYNEHRGNECCRLTTFYHGVKFYSPHTTTFNVTPLRVLTADWMQKASKDDLETLRPRVFVDQLQDIIHSLKTDPMSRRMIVNSWEPSLIPDESLPPKENPPLGLPALTPCHHEWQVTTRKVSVKELSKWLDINDEYFLRGFTYTDELSKVKKIELEEIRYKEALNRANAVRFQANLPPLKPLTLDLRFSMRSTDVFFGLPFNIASYATLAHLLAKLVDMNAGELLYQGTDVHIYENTFNQMFQQTLLTPNSFPTIEIADIDDIDNFTVDHVMLLNYVHGPAISGVVSV